jgi:uncharacterized protein (TIGR04206 family)
VTDGGGGSAPDADGGTTLLADAAAPRTHSDARTVLVLLCLAAVPWSVQVFDVGDATFLFAWGLVNTNPLQVTTLSQFLFVYTAGLPDYILAWPVSVCLWAGSVVSAAVGARTGREDVRVTAGLLVLAGVAQVTLARGFSVQPYRAAYPVGTAALWAAAWWFYWPAIRRRVRAWRG